MAVPRLGRDGRHRSPPTSLGIVTILTRTSGESAALQAPLTGGGAPRQRIHRLKEAPFSRPWEVGAPVSTMGHHHAAAGRSVAGASTGMARLTVLCFAGTYGLALFADLARSLVRAQARWSLTVALTAL